MNLFKRTQFGFWGNSLLDYKIYWFLAVIGGFFALDHLYLRSPYTFIAKLVVNAMTFGVWYVYDVLQATFNKEKIKLFGVSVPGIGPNGIGAGMFLNEPSTATDEQKAKVGHYFMYTLILLFTGLLGGDSFYMGDKVSGFIRLFSVLSFIFFPVAAIWYVINLGKWVLTNDKVVDQNWDFFGAPRPEGALPSGASILDKLQTIPIVGTAVEAGEKVVEAATSTVKAAVDTVSAVGNVAGAAASLAGKISQVASGDIGAVIGTTPPSVANIKEAAERTSVPA
jgi:TM2 domain-containing membrane protein YozV